MENKNKNLAVRLLAIAFFVFIVVFACLNLSLAAKPVARFLTKETDFPGFVTEIQDAYTSEEWKGNNFFVSFNGLFARLTGQRICNDVVLMENGMLTETLEKVNMEPMATAITEFSGYLEKTEGIPFLYVQAPYKEDAEDALLPVGIDSYANENADELLAALNSGGVKNLDLRPYLSETVELIEENYFVTDHHWNYYGAFTAFQKIAEKTAELFPEKRMDLSCTQLENWSSNTLEDWFLGSRGKRVGAWYVGTDDLTWLVPDFETRMSCAIPKYRSLYSGSFSDANLRTQYITEKKYFKYNAYCLYIGGDYPLVQHRNLSAGSDLKVLLIKDSYSLPVQAFLSTLFQELDVLDPRHYTECSIAEYVQRTKPDLVLMLTNPSMFGTTAYRKFGIEEVEEKKTYTSVFKEQNILVEPSDSSQYHYYHLDVDYGKKYKLSFEDVEVLQGDAAGVVVSLYNQTKKTILSTAVFDVEYCRETDGFEWIVETPDSGTDRLWLIFYAGLPGNTKNVSVVYKNVALQEETKETAEVTPALPAATETPVPTTPSPSPTVTVTPSPTPTATPSPTPSPSPTATPTPTEKPLVVAIDPGHQRKGNYEKEPIGPGSEELKAKVSSGTSGVSTGIPEYELTLAVSLYLREELLARGYEVIMTRETHDVDISNVERALLANEAEADAFIRVHADSSTNSSAKGVLTICQTPNNPYNSEWYTESQKLSELVLEEVVEETGAKKRYIWETDTMTGINWTTVPTTILEMGFMSNPEEDELMATEEYRKKVAIGVANAIDRYLKGEEAE